MGLPSDLEPDSSALSEEVRLPTTINHVDTIARQNDRIGYLRSMAFRHPHLFPVWEEAVMQQRDNCVGLEDDEFFDGLPPHKRQEVERLEAEGKKSKAKKIREEWAVHGWDGYPCRAVRGPGGVPKFIHTPEQLSWAYRIILRLLDRNGMLWKTQKKSRVKPKPKPDDPPLRGRDEEE